MIILINIQKKVPIKNNALSEKKKEIQLEESFPNSIEWKKSR
jgi:hypothetical protein